MTIPLLIDRDPEAATARTRNFIDMVRSILNPLLLDGTIFQDGQQSYGVTNLFFVGNGPPDAAQGYVGDFYLDIGNPTVATLYRKDN